MKRQFSFSPLSSDKWPDLEILFGKNGACGGCWCMWWRLKRSDFNLQKGAQNKNALREVVLRGDIPGILAYDGETPVAWMAVQPRETYPALARSRILKPVDHQEVWSITCFFILRKYRRKGISTQLLEYAKTFCKSRGAKTLEGYPNTPKSGKIPDAFAWTGIDKAFLRAGFTEVARRSPQRPIMRIDL